MQKLIWCGRGGRDLKLGERRPDVIVLPEGVSMGTVRRTAVQAPNAVIAGAVRVGQHMKGVLRYDGRNRVQYMKVHSDRWTAGSPPPARCPILEIADLAVGLVICVDVQDAKLMHGVIGALNASAAPWKVLCVPMKTYAGGLFSTEPVCYPTWERIHVAVSNSHRGYPDNRLRNFISDVAGKKVIEQEVGEPISLLVG
jgi:hypothetical protein